MRRLGLGRENWAGVTYKEWEGVWEEKKVESSRGGKIE